MASFHLHVSYCSWPVLLFFPCLRNHTVLRGAQRHVTRFIALANVGNPDKKNRVGELVCVCENVVLVRGNSDDSNLNRFLM